EQCIAMAIEDLGECAEHDAHVYGEVLVAKAAESGQVGEQDGVDLTRRLARGTRALRLRRARRDRYHVSCVSGTAPGFDVARGPRRFPSGLSVPHRELFGVDAEECGPVERM